MHDTARECLEDFMTDDEDFAAMSKILWQCKITDEAHVAKLDEVKSTNYDAVLAMMNCMKGQHCLKFEVNKAIRGRDIIQAHEPQDASVDQGEEDIDQGIKPKKNRRSMVDQIKNLPRSVSNGLRASRKGKKRDSGGSDLKKRQGDDADVDVDAGETEGFDWGDEYPYWSPRAP